MKNLPLLVLPFTFLLACSESKPTSVVTKNYTEAAAQVAALQAGIKASLPTKPTEVQKANATKRMTEGAVAIVGHLPLLTVLSEVPDLEIVKVGKVRSPSGHRRIASMLRSARSWGTPRRRSTRRPRSTRGTRRSNC